MSQDAESEVFPAPIMTALDRRAIGPVVESFLEGKDARSVLLRAGIITNEEFGDYTKAGKKRIENRKVTYKRRFSLEQQVQESNFDIPLLENCVRPEGYKPHLLLARGEAANAYRQLTTAVFSLGVADQLAGDPKAVAQPETPVEAIHLLARAAACTLAGTMGCDCWTAYTWQPHEILPVLAGTGGLYYPEAMAGLPHLGVAHAARSAPCAVVVQPSGLADTGSFRRREEIETTLQVILPVNNHSLVIYLNWRHADSEGPADHMIRTDGSEWASRVWQAAMRGPLAVSNDIASDDVLRSLRPTLLYIAGWLSRRSAQLFEPGTHVPRTAQGLPAVEIHRSVMQIFSAHYSKPGEQRSPNTFIQDVLIKIGRPIEALVSQVPGADSIQLHVLPVVEKTALDLSSVQGPLYDWHGKAAMTTKVSSFAETDQRGLVGAASGLAVQAMAWRTSILMEVIPKSGAWPAREDSLAARLLSKTRRRKERSEFAVPIFSGSTPIAAINIEVEQANALSAFQTRWVEGIGLMVGALCRLYMSNDKESIECVERSAKGRIPPSENAMWRHFTEFVLGIVDADLAYVVTRGRRTHELDTLGVSTTGTYRRMMMLEGASDLRAACASAAEMVELLKDEVQQSRSVRLHAVLIADAIVALLDETDRREVHWYLNGEPKALKPRPRPTKAGSLLNRISEPLESIPLAPHPSLGPYAVLKVSRRYDGSATALDYALVERIKRVGAVFAAIHMLHRIEKFSGTASPRTGIHVSKAAMH